MCAIAGSFFLSIILVLNSRAPATYHLGFPTIVRATAGMYGSYFFILIRIAVAVIYFSIQTYFASNLMSVLLRCIFGHKWANMPNHLPSSAGVTSKGLLSFFLIWIIQFPMMLIHPRHQRHIYTIKFVTTLASLLGVLGYCSRKAGGLGTPETLNSNRVYGEDLAWGIMSGINSIIGSLMPILVNTGDIVRYSRRPRDSSWIQSFGVLSSKVLITFFGAATTSAAREFLGTAFWNPWDLYNALLDYHWTASMRTGMFFASLSMVYALVAVNLGTNCLPVGADLTAALPSFISIRRGQVICWILAPVLVPWLLVSSGAKFVAFLGSYTTLLSPIAATMILDYFYVRKGNYHILSFYDNEKSSPFWYGSKFGVNWRAMVAWCCGVGLSISGISNTLDPGSVSQVAVKMYKLGFLISFSFSSVVFFLLNRFFPVPTVLPDGYDLKTTSFEELAKNDGYLEGESVEMITGDQKLEVFESVSSNSEIEKNAFRVNESKLDV